MDEQENKLKIGTINLNGNAWWRLNDLPNIPLRESCIRSIQNEMIFRWEECISKLIGEEDEEYDIIAIQELLYKKEYLLKLEDFLEKKGYKLIYTPMNCRFISAFIIKDKLKYTKGRTESNRFLPIEIEYHGTNIQLINVHISLGKEQEINFKGFLKFIEDIKKNTNSSNIILLGDFNTYTCHQTTNSKTYIDGDKAVKENVDLFEQFKSDCDLNELGNDNDYTYKTSNGGNKLDHIFISNDLKIKYTCDLSVDHDVNFFQNPNGCTDHSMLTLTLKFTISTTPSHHKYLSTNPQHRTSPHGQVP